MQLNNISQTCYLHSEFKQHWTIYGICLERKSEHDQIVPLNAKSDDESKNKQGEMLYELISHTHQ